MAESTSRSFQSTTSSKQPFKLQRIGSKADGRRLFLPNASFEAGLNQTAISNTSSAVNDSDAVGVATRKEEATINTKLAMRELSMMFSSPAFGVEGRKPHNRSTASMIYENSGEEAADESFGNLGDGLMLDNSICNTRAGAREKNSSFPSHAAPRSSMQKQDSSSNKDGFKNFENNQNNDKLDGVSKSSFAHGFQIYQDDENEDMSQKDVSRVHVSSLRSVASESDESSNGGYEHGDTASISEAMAIFGAEEFGVRQQPENNNTEGDTATLSLFNDVFSKEDQNLSPPNENEKIIYPKASFQIFVDDDEVHKEIVS
jgi:hypothetical protein